MAEANLRWKADTAEAIAKTEALKRVVASVGGSSTTGAIKSLASNWKILVPAVAAASVAILGLTGNLAALAPLIPPLTVALTGLIAPFTTLAAVVVGFIPPLTLLGGLLGGLAVAFGVSGVQAIGASKRYTGLAKIVGDVKKAFGGLTAALIHDFMPTFKFLGTSAATALKYLTQIAHLPLKQAFQSLSTTGVAGFQKFLDHVGHILARPIRLAFQVAFGKSDTLRKALVDDWNDIVNFFVGKKGVALPVEKWFGKQDFTKVGYRWAAELAGAFMTGLGMALKKLWASQGGKFLLGGASIGALVGAFTPVGPLIGAAIGTGIGIGLNHYWPKITADASKAFHAVGAFAKKALGPQLWGQIISLARSFWDTLKAVGGYIQNHIWPVVRHVFNALGGWHTVGVIIIGVVRAIVGAFVAVAGAVRIVYNVIQTVVHWIQRAANAVKGGLTGAWDGVVSAAKSVVGVINSIVGAIKTAVGWAQALASALPDNPFSGGPGGTAGRTARTGRHRVATGGIVTGGIPGRDSVPALLTPGEVVLNRKQQLALLNGGTGGTTVNVNVTWQSLTPPTPQQMSELGRRVAQLVDPHLGRMHARRA
jgi:phage-related protein